MEMDLPLVQPQAQTLQQGPGLGHRVRLRFCSLRPLRSSVAPPCSALPACSAGGRSSAFRLAPQLLRPPGLHSQWTPNRLQPPLALWALGLCLQLVSHHFSLGTHYIPVPAESSAWSRSASGPKWYFPRGEPTAPLLGSVLGDVKENEAGPDLRLLSSE